MPKKSKAQRTFQKIKTLKPNKTKMNTQKINPATIKPNKMNITKLKIIAKPTQKLAAISISALVKEFFATTYMLYLKTQNFHWNVIGSDFFELHLLFEKQYEEMQEAIDVIAEHIRTMKTSTPSSFKEFLELSKIKESLGNKPPSSKEMLRILERDNNTICQLADDLIEQSGEDKAKDMATQDLMIDRLRAHRANAWMLRSSLENKR